MGKYINTKIIRAKFVRSLYFMEKENQENLEKHIHINQDHNFETVLEKVDNIKFNWKDKFFLLYNLFTQRKLKKQKRTRMQDIYKQGWKMVSSEMNLFNMIQTLQKLKAATSILIGDDRKKMDTIQKLYLMNSTIYCNKEHKKDFENSKNEFMKFLERDERVNKKTIEDETHVITNLAK